MSEFLLANEGVLKEDAAMLKVITDHEGWKTFDLWLADREAELIEGLIKRDSEKARGWIEAMRYFRQLPQMVIQAAAEEDKEARESDTSNEAPQSDEITPI